MKIIIHQGIDQIGGCITVITTDNAKFLIDLSQNLTDGEGYNTLRKLYHKLVPL